MTPRVSVLMPVRDAAATVDEALDTLLADPLREIEIVCVDDGSADDSRARLHARAARDGRVVVLEQERLGLVAALNHGLAACRAPLVARHDADDLSVPGRLRDQADYLGAHPEVDVLATRCEIFRDGGAARLGMRRWADWSNALETHEAMRRERFVESPIAHPSVMLRAATLAACGAYRDGDFPEDYELWLRLFAAGRRFARLPAVGVRVRDHARRSIRNQPQYRPEAFRALKLAHLRREFLTDGEPILVCGGGRIAKGWVRFLRQEGLPVAALVDVDPRRVGHTVHGVPVVWPEDAAKGSALGRGKALSAVGQPGGRDNVRRRLTELGFVEEIDFVCVA